MSDYEIASVILASINTVSIFLLIAQTFISTKQSKQIREQTQNMSEQTQKMSEQTELMNQQNKLTLEHAKELHEEQRRIKTVEVLWNWDKGLRKETRLAEMIVEGLNEKDCMKLYEFKSFRVNKSTHNMFCQMCPDYQECKDNKKCKPNKQGKYLISGHHLNELRRNVTSYLNNLEIVSVAWQQEIVDTEMIEAQFAFLYNEGKKSALSKYRKIAGNGNSYPTLNDFYEKIKSNNTIDLPKKHKQ